MRISSARYPDLRQFDRSKNLSIVPYFQKRCKSIGHDLEAWSLLENFSYGCDCTWRKRFNIFETLDTDALPWSPRGRQICLVTKICYKFLNIKVIHPSLDNPGNSHRCELDFCAQKKLFMAVHVEWESEIAAACLWTCEHCIESIACNTLVGY